MQFDVIENTMANKLQNLMSRDTLFFKYTKSCLNTHMSLPRKRHIKGIYKPNAIYFNMEGDYIKKNCVS